MKNNSQILFLALFVFFFFRGVLILSAEEITKPISVFVEGKEYKSIKAYKKEQMKELLIETMSNDAKAEEALNLNNTVKDLPQDNLRDVQLDEIKQILADLLAEKKTKDRNIESDSPSLLNEKNVTADWKTIDIVPNANYEDKALLEEIKKKNEQQTKE